MQKPHLSQFRQIMMSLYWFAVSVQWTAILITTLPKQALLIGGDVVKGQTLGNILLAGAFVSMVVAPLFGAISDRTVTRFGRRRPWIIVGTLMNVIGIFGLIFFARTNDISSLPMYIIAFMWVEFWNNVATAPFSALIPDVVPIEQRGSASGWYGLMTMLGNFVGGVAGLLFTQNGITDINAIYYFIAAIMVLGMLGTVIFVKEPAITLKPPPFNFSEFVNGLITPFKNKNFRWVFWTRFFIEMGAYTVQEFLQYYMGDVIKDFRLFGQQMAQNAESAVSFFIIAVLVGAIASSLIAGILSDRLGRKLIVYISGVVQAITPFIWIFFGSFPLTVVTGLIFGLGYGAYTSVDWALASDVLPSDTDHAKDMGVWHIAMTLPQVVSTPVAGFLLDNFQNIGKHSSLPALGYQVIFLIATLYFILGTVLIQKVRNVK